MKPHKPGLSHRVVDAGQFLISLLINSNFFFFFIGHIIECCSMLHRLCFLCSVLSECSCHVRSLTSECVCVSSIKNEDTAQKFSEKVPKGGAISSHVVVKQN